MSPSPVELAGAVRMDRKAFASFLTAGTIEWFVGDPYYGVSGGCLDVSGSSDATFVVSASASVVFDADTLGVKLVEASQAGTIIGAFEHFDIGSGVRTVYAGMGGTTPDSSPILIGVDACPNAPLELAEPFVISRRYGTVVTPSGYKAGVKVGPSRLRPCFCGAEDGLPVDGRTCANEGASAGVEPFFSLAVTVSASERLLVGSFTRLLDDPDLSDAAAYLAGVVLLSADCRNARLVDRWLSRYPEPPGDLVRVTWEDSPVFAPYAGGVPAYRPMPAREGMWFFGADEYEYDASWMLPAGSYKRVCAAATALMGHGMSPFDAMGTAIDLEASV